VRCQSCLASENVSSYTPLNRSGRLHPWRPFLLFIRSVPRPFQTYPHRCEVGRYRPRPSRAPNQHPVQRLKTFNPISSATFFKTAKFNCCKTIVAGSSRHPFYIRSISAGDIGYRHRVPQSLDQSSNIPILWSSGKASRGDSSMLVSSSQQYRRVDPCKISDLICPLSGQLTMQCRDK
jgi:hypothetical protein